MPSTSPGSVNPGMGSTYESDSLYPLTDRFKGKSKASKKEIDRMVAWTKQTFLEIKTARTSIERRWMLNMCFYDGRQHVMFRNTNNIIQGTMGQLVVPPAPYWRARPVINRIRPIIRTELSKLTSQKPSAYIIPNSSEEQLVNFLYLLVILSIFMKHLFIFLCLIYAKKKLKLSHI